MLLGVGVVVYLFRCRDMVDGVRSEIGGVSKILAGLTAVLAVSAYNLRMRVVDYTLKMLDRGVSSALAKGNLERTGRRLTNLVLLSFVASLSLFMTTDWIVSSVVGPAVVGLSCGLFTACCVQYLYVLFAFEKLEHIIMDERSQEIEERENARKQEALEKRRRERPDTPEPEHWKKGGGGEL